MRIQSASEYNLAYADYRVSHMAPVQEEQNIEQSSQLLAPKQVFVAEEDTAVSESQAEKPGRIADLDHISLTFNTEESYDYIGRDSSIDNLDIQKAISDMKKDQVLEHYQYFVGSSDNMLQGKNTEDGIVIPKFDHFLLP